MTMLGDDEDILATRKYKSSTALKASLFGVTLVGVIRSLLFK